MSSSLSAETGSNDVKALAFDGENLWVVLGLLRSNPRARLLGDRKSDVARRWYRTRRRA